MFGGGSGMDDILSTPSGGEYLKKATTTLAVIFFATSLFLAMRTTTETSLMDGVREPVAPQQLQEDMPVPEEFDDLTPFEEGEVPADEPPPLQVP